MSLFRTGGMGSQPKRPTQKSHAHMLSIPWPVSPISSSWIASGTSRRSWGSGTRKLTVKRLLVKEWTRTGWWNTRPMRACSWRTSIGAVVPAVVALMAPPVARLASLGTATHHPPPDHRHREGEERPAPEGRQEGRIAAPGPAPVPERLHDASGQEGRDEHAEPGNRGPRQHAPGEQERGRQPRQRAEDRDAHA